MLFGTLFKYMDKDKEDGGETSKSKADEGNDSQEESVSKENEEKLKAGEPDLTTPPPPHEEMDTADVPPST